MNPYEERQMTKVLLCKKERIIFAKTNTNYIFPYTSDISALFLSFFLIKHSVLLRINLKLIKFKFNL